MDYQLIDVTLKAVLADRLKRAEGFGQQLIGLIGAPVLPAGSGLWLPRCNAIHTFGLRFPIDVLFADVSWRVVRLLHTLPPLRICLPIRHACHTIELPAGTLKHYEVEIGDLLAIQGPGARLISRYLAFEDEMKQEDGGEISSQ